MSEYLNICENYNLLNYFHNNDEIIITRKPTQWSSGSGGECPLYLNDCDFPRIVKISNIKYHDCTHHVSFRDGEYGWCLSTLIREDAIDTIKTLRRKKLKTIYETL